MLRDAGSRVLGFLALVVLTRLLSPSEFGTAAFGLTFLAIGVFAGSLGVDASLIRSRQPPSNDELGALFALQLVSSIVAICLCLALLPLSGEPGRVALGMLAALPLFAVRGPASTWCAHQLNFRPISVSTLAEMLAYYGAAIGAAVVGAGSWAFVAGVWARALVGTLVIRVMTPHIRVSPRWRGPLIREHALFGIQFQAVNLTVLTRDQVLNFVASLNGGVSGVGIWAITTRVTQPIVFVFSAVNQALFPLFSRLRDERGEQGDISAEVARVAGYSSIAAAGIATTIVASLPDSITLLLGDRWGDSADILRLALFAAALWGAAEAVTTSVLFANGLAARVLRIHAMSAMVWIGTATAMEGAFSELSMGIGWASGAIVFSTMAAVELRRHGHHITRALAAPTASAVTTVAVLRLAAPELPWAVSAFLASALYLAAGTLLFRRDLLALLGTVRFKRS